MNADEGESPLFEMKRIKTIVKVPKYLLSVNNKVLFLKQLNSKLRSSYLIMCV